MEIDRRRNGRRTQLSSRCRKAVVPLQTLPRHRRQKCDSTGCLMVLATLIAGRDQTTYISYIVRAQALTTTPSSDKITKMI